VTVQAWVWSSTLGKKLTGTFGKDSEAREWQSRQRTGRIHGQEVDPNRAKLSFGYSRTSPRQNRLASEKIGAVLRRVPLETTGE
jgi:hypothetical protein